jgi:hypothetical protein
MLEKTTPHLYRNGDFLICRQEIEATCSLIIERLQQAWHRDAGGNLLVEKGYPLVIYRSY